MQYEMLQNTGAFNEGTTKSPHQRHRLLVNPEELGLTGRIRKSLLASDMGITQKLVSEYRRHKEERNFHRQEKAQRAASYQENEEKVQRVNYREERKGMFFYVIAEGQRALIRDKHGKGTIITGPARLWKMGKKIYPLEHHIAYPAEFLIVKHRDGSQYHIPGPKEVWLDPRIHENIEKADALQIAGKEAVVVYTKDDKDNLARRVIHGPALFVPNPGEWLHTFNWHGAKDDSYKKVPGGLVFQKLWLMPDQMYHDVEEVRTADDIMLTIKLMIFFELVDVEKMLEETHDPIGDFINATSSDVIELVSRHTLDQFKLHTEKLNDIQSYPQLLSRATQVGYKIHKIVYRGYAAATALQNMQQQAIETRTRLKLESETEEQAQKLADFKQNCEFQRAGRQREQDKQQALHEIEKQKLLHHQEMEISQERNDLEYKSQQQSQEQRLQYLSKLKDMSVDLTAYLTQQRADEIIELRSGQTNVLPHVHLNK